MSKAEEIKKILDECFVVNEIGHSLRYAPGHATGLLSTLLAEYAQQVSREKDLEIERLEQVLKEILGI